MPRFSRCRIALLLVLLLLPSALQAAEPRRAAEALQSASVAVNAWDALARMWSYLTGAQLDNGCSVDPSGFCRKTATTDNGCWLDPDGRCRN